MKASKDVSVDKANAAYEEAAKAAELAVKRAQEAAADTTETGKGIWQKVWLTTEHSSEVSQTSCAYEVRNSHSHFKAIHLYLHKAGNLGCSFNCCTTDFGDGAHHRDPFLRQRFFCKCSQ